MKIFVSYSRKDAGDFAQQINRYFTSFRYDVFTDIESISAGDVWDATIETNISNCDIFVVIITYGALDSPHVGNEVLQAQKEKKRIIPCLHRTLRYSEIKWGLNKIQGVEFDDKFELARNLYPKILQNKNDISKVKKDSSLSLSSAALLSKDISSSSSVVKEQPAEEQKEKESHFHHPTSTTIEKKQLWIRPKILIPIIIGAVVISSTLGYTFLGVNSIPVANAGSHQTVKSGDIVALDGSKSTDSDGTIISYLWTQSLGPTVMLNNPNTVSPRFTAPNFTSDTKLIFDLTTKDNKGTTSKPASVDIIVKPVKPRTKLSPPPITVPPIGNHSPIAHNKSVVTSMNKAVDITLTASDPEINDNLTAAVVIKPLHGTLGNINQITGNITYTPSQGFIGTDRFTYKVNDGKADSNGVGTIKITVNQLSLSKNIVTNHPPIADDQSVTTNKNTPVDITLGASDAEPNDNLTAQIVSPPSDGRLNDINQVTGIMTYSPNPNFIGTDRFTYKVNDGKADSNKLGIISITVREVKT